MADPLMTASWGSILVFCSELNTDSGRTKVVHDLTNGDVHPVQDRGRRARRARAKVVFDEFPGAPKPRDAALAFENAVASGASAIFTHPMLGSYLAGVGDFELHIDESDVISADVEFIAESEVPTISPAGAGTTGISGELAVGATADTFDAEARKVMTDEEIRDILEDEDGLSIADDAKQSTASWSVPEETLTRQVLIDAARLSNRIATAIELGGFENDIALWPCFQSAIMLGEAIRSAAIAATSEVSSTFVMRIQQPTALLPLSARVYGGAAAAERARQILSLNDIPTPAWLPPGDYLFPARTSAQRSQF